MITLAVYASLANVLGCHENMPSPVPSHIRDYKLFDVEIKYGLLQVGLYDGLPGRIRLFIGDTFVVLCLSSAPFVLLRS